jgi:N-acetylglucosaminyldiphosphoundecaprenol N-acetyl-beta-D-mannosaminyltransferase
MQLIQNEKHNQIIFLTLTKLMKARNNKDYKKQLNEAALVLPTSKSLTKGVKFLYKLKAERYMPYDYIITLLTLLEQKRKSVYLLGSSYKVLAKADKNLRATYPQLLFVGRYNGYFKKKELPLITETIRKASPTLLITSRGLKQQEKWVYYNKEEFKAGFSVYLNDFFDIVAEKKQRPNRKRFQQGSDSFFIFLKKPWRIFILFIVWHYYLLLAFYKLNKKEGQHF